MPLIVEDGTGVDDADSYVSVAELESYIEARHPSFTINYIEVEAALRRATAYIDLTYYGKWIGQPFYVDQSLLWPRAVSSYYAWLYEIPGGIPKLLKDATCEAAMREMTSPNSLLPDIVPSERIVEETVGPIHTRYAESGIAIPSVPLIDRMLAPLVTSGGQSIAVFPSRV
jgi:hypothetical protein